MTTFAVIEAKARHCGQISRIMRFEHHVAMLSLGGSPHRQIRESYDQSYFRRAWLIDGKLAGLGGVIGSEMSAFGFVWLALSTAAQRYPLEIVREARRQLDSLMKRKVELWTTVIDGDEAALRLAAFLGFHTAEYGIGARAYSLHGRRRLLRHIHGEPDLLVPVGRGFGVKMSYMRPEMN